MLFGILLHTHMFAQIKNPNCHLIKKSIEIQECSIKNEVLEKVLDEMIGKMEEEEVYEMKIPHRKYLSIERSILGVTIELYLNDSYISLEDDSTDDMVFFNYKGFQFLIQQMKNDIFKEFFQIKKGKGIYTAYYFKNEKDGTCLNPVIIDQKIIYEIRGTKYRFQEKTLTHTELYW